MSTARCASASAFRHLHATFLAMVPRIVAHGQVYFRHLKCPLQKEEALAEMTALVWSWHVRLTQRGKDTSQFVSAPAWRLTRTERDRRIVDRLMLGDRTTEISRKFGISPGRISQLRRELYEDWCRFCADPGAAF